MLISLKNIYGQFALLLLYNKFESISWKNKNLTPKMKKGKENGSRISDNDNIIKLIFQNLFFI
jgi:hypothetical protein